MLNRSDLAGDAAALVEALIASHLAWQTPAELSRISGLELQVTLDALAVLDCGGWIVPFEQAPAGISVTFTPLACEVLRIRIIEVGSAEVPRWADSDRPEPPAPVAFGTFSGINPLAVLGLADRREIDPAVAVELVEQIEIELSLEESRERRNERRRDHQAEALRASSARDRRRDRRRARNQARQKAGYV